MKNTWKKPMLEILDVSKTFNGSGDAIPDCYTTENPQPGRSPIQDPETSNAACKPKGNFGS
ncbi:paeninodin family lasso peptide [Halalkalibacter akibai]|uniref:paeninodin family lasso peptide n=1 Tax=Halalkalibacter akibai TaxID=1411 RepID=UPI00055843A5|nr:paeninodin family lasso peptide [Halalkalibacter akibai]